MSRRRLAILATHPIHYQIGLARRLQEDPAWEVTMLFCSRFGLGEQVDHTFGKAVVWYAPSILEGIRHRFLLNYSWERTPSHFWGAINPGIIRETGRGSYDAVLLQGYSVATEWLALAAKRSPCRLLFRGETVYLPGRSRGNRLMQRLIMRILSSRVDFFFPIGSRSRDFYLRHGIPPERLILSPYAVDNDRFFSEARRLSNQRPALRAALGIPEGLPVILSVLKLVPRKRPLDLLRAFEGHQDSATLVLVGDGPLRPQAEAFVRDRSLKNVHLAGFQNQEELPRFYAVADLFVLPSEYEPWGLVLNEAMCFGLPVVTTRGVAASADLVREGENGFVIDPGDTAELEKGLGVLIHEPQRRREMGLRSAEIIRPWGQAAAADGIRRGLA